jgi:hypothetical protein
MPNYTQQDITGSLLATALFPIVLLIPGYVIGWAFDIFDFRKRQLIAKHIIGIVLSNAVSPISLFLIYRFTSAEIAIACLLLCSIVYLTLLAKELLKRIRDPKTISAGEKKNQKIAVWVAAGIAIFIIAWLVDIQFQNHLYYSIASYDLTTRVAIVNAITRTGVPPINPGYYPGHPVQLTYLYYFWYILASVIDRLGGNMSSAYHSMIGSIIWSGISVIATLALYLRLRTKERDENYFQRFVIVAQLILVGGLDFIPITMAAIQEKILLGRLPYEGHLESWNTPIMSWPNAIVWVPHHIASALACITALLLIIYGCEGSFQKKAIAVMLSGFAFASAFGLSVWVMLTFAVFWCVWIMILAFQKERRTIIPLMILAGALGIVLAAPFLAGLIGSSGNKDAQGTLPIAFYVRPFMAIIYFDFLPRIARLVLNLFFLPINYLFEFGFLLVTAILWIQGYRKPTFARNIFRQAELVLVATITILLSFVYSTVIQINDLGMRGWLPMQFILIIWAVDVLQPKLAGQNRIHLNAFKRFSEVKRLGLVMGVTFVIGLLSSLTDIVTIRTWPILVDLDIVGFPNELSPDTHLGERTFAARQMYDYLRDHVSENTVIQSNPLTSLDRPGGLYGDHQMALADRTIYGVSSEEFENMSQGIGRLFEFQNVSEWALPDEICKEYSIGAIIVDDVDPLWTSIDQLALIRPPIYRNKYYAAFRCGQ